jgi:hypothetical protein
MHRHIVPRVQEIEEDGLQFAFVGGNAGERAGEVGCYLRDGLYGFVAGAGEAELVFEGARWVEVVRHGGQVGLGSVAGVEDGDVGAVDLRKMKWLNRLPMSSVRFGFEYLIPTERVEVHAEILHIDRTMRREAHAVDAEQGTCSVHYICDGFDVVDTT